MTRLAAHGLAVEPPAGWDVRIYKRAVSDAGETTHPILHAGNFPLPPGRGDYGSGAVERMGNGHAWVALLEFDAASAHTALFATAGMPRPRPQDFHPRALQRTLRGQSGAQWFFHVGERAFCLYVVLGSHTRRARLLPQVHEVLDRLSIGDGQVRAT